MDKKQLIKDCAVAQEQLKKKYIDTWADELTGNRSVAVKRARVKTTYCFMQLVVDLLKQIPVDEVQLSDDGIYGIDRLLLREQH